MLFRSMNKSRIYQQLKKPEKAIQEMERLIGSDSTNVQAYALLAELYQSIGNNEKALESFRKIESIDPENAYIHLSLADFYRTAGDKEKSFDQLKLAFRNRQLEIDTKISILSSYYSLVVEHPELKEQAIQLCDILLEVHEIGRAHV